MKSVAVVALDCDIDDVQEGTLRGENCRKKRFEVTTKKCEEKNWGLGVKLNN
mgnify:CR=1 FL=1